MAIITLTTDIGTSDFIVGAIKGQMLQALPTVQIADITHQLSPDNYLQAAYICNGAFGHYPHNTIHIVLIQLFEEPLSHLLIAEYNHQFIICPDNGILTMIVGVRPMNVFTIPIPQALNMGILHYSAQIILFCKQIIQTNRLSDIATATNTFIEKYPPLFTAGQDWIDCQIIYVDRFENVVINITKKEFEAYRKNRAFKIVLPSRTDTHIEEIVSNYSAVKQSEKVAWFNSAGYLELAVKNGNIAGLFGLKSYAASQSEAIDSRQLNYERVRIFFE